MMMTLFGIWQTLLIATTVLTTGVSAKRPNVVFILTDDQDLHMDSLSYMPNVKKHLIDQGTYYQKHYCTVALCCPSRVSLLTGKAAHNTNVTDVEPPYGGYRQFIDQDLNQNYLPVWLQKAGYNTYYTGKLMNFYHILNYNKPFAAGWTSSDFLLDPYTYSYLESVWQRDRSPPKSAAGQYSTDILAEKAYAYIEEGASSDAPFFVALAPIAPHANVDVNINGSNVSHTSGDPIPADRHKSLFSDVVVPRTPNFNPDVPSGVSWVARLPQQSQTEVDYNDGFYRNRLRALQAVDEMVDGIFQKLESLGILEETYVVYSSDNGFHIGHHRLQPGKRCGFEEDINVPLIIRGPGVPQGATTEIVTTHTDLAPTFFDMLGIDLRDDFDGAPIPLTRTGIDDAVTTRHEHVNVEHWGTVNSEGVFGNSSAAGTKENPENTYKALRLVGKEHNFYYSVFCNNEHELYNLTADPYQMNNLMSSSSKNQDGFAASDLQKMVHRLDALLMVLKTCVANDCIDPWGILHPQGDVRNLEDALNPKYDAFYAKSFETNSVSFTKCEAGQILSSEGSLEPSVYPGQVSWEDFS
ncbi:unnamed protein product [Penicillium salamii]|nr:unnamed protein product [Penicillium salamii]